MWNYISVAINSRAFSIRFNSESGQCTVFRCCTGDCFVVCCPGVFVLLQVYAFLQYLKDRLTRQEFQTLFFLGVSVAAGVVFLSVIYLTYTGELHTRKVCLLLCFVVCVRACVFCFFLHIYCRVLYEIQRRLSKDSDFLTVESVWSEMVLKPWLSPAPDSPVLRLRSSPLTASSRSCFTQSVAATPHGTITRRRVAGEPGERGEKDVWVAAHLKQSSPSVWLGTVITTI